MPRSAVNANVVVSVVIPTYNRSLVLSQTLGRLAAQSVAVAWEVVVVNNRCTDDTDQVVARWTASFPTVLRIVHEHTPGASAARNCGIAAARGSLLVFLDDDIALGPGQLDRAVADHLAQPTWWFVARILPLPEHLSTPFGSFRSAVASHPTERGPLPEVDTFASGFGVVPRASVIDVGGYSEDYPTAALEDADLFIRAHHRGIRVSYDAELMGIHNDWAGASLRDFCQRQRVYCRTAPLLEERFGGEAHPWSALIDTNRPPQCSEGAAVRSRKRVKSLLSHRLPIGALLLTAEFLERIKPARPLLWFVYRITIAASMYGGYQEGLRLGGRPRASA